MTENKVPRGPLNVLTPSQIRSLFEEKSQANQYAVVNKSKDIRLSNPRALPPLPPKPVNVIAKDGLQRSLRNKELQKYPENEELQKSLRNEQFQKSSKSEELQKSLRSEKCLGNQELQKSFKRTGLPVSVRSQDEGIRKGEPADLLEPPRQTGSSKKKTVTFDLDDEGDYVQLRMCEKVSEMQEPTPANENSVDFNVYLLEEDKKLKGVLELSTLRQNVIDKVYLRVVCLFDVSGSMLLKCGRSRRHSKLTVLRKMAADVVDVLEDNDDFVGLVTFGETAETVWPLTRINSNNRADIKDAIGSLGNVTCLETDLFSGLEHAINLLSENDETSRLLYRNAIIIFSDGEINKGITDPETLVSRTREAIKACHVTSDLETDRWINIACVTTGGYVSEAMYFLSKYCGSDAFYYVDNQGDHPEVDMMIPLLLRKSAIAQFVSLSITTINGAALNRRECSREHSIRRRQTKQTENKEMNYYLHDLAAGTQKHFSVAVDVACYDKNKDIGLMWITLEYVDAKGNVQNISKSIKFSDRITVFRGPDVNNKGLMENAKQEMRCVSQTACRETAVLVQQDADDDPTRPLKEGKLKLDEISERYSQLASRAETKSEIREFCSAIQTNMSRLIESIEKSKRGVGHKWSKIKAVSSSIYRECPNVAHLVADSELLCPMPIVSDCVSLRTKALAMKVTCRESVTSGLFDGYPEDLFGAAQMVAQSLSEIMNKLHNTGRKLKVGDAEID